MCERQTCYAVADKLSRKKLKLNAAFTRPSPEGYFACYRINIAFLFPARIDHCNHRRVRTQILLRHSLHLRESGRFDLRVLGVAVRVA